MTDDLTAWVVEQQTVADESVRHNKTAVFVRGCILCGRTDTHVVYRFGRADEPVCADREACEARQIVLHGERRMSDAEQVRQTLRDALRYAYEGRDSHIAWAEHLEAHANGEPCQRCTDDVVETAGDAAHQREWVRKYDTIIEALTVNVSPLIVEAVAKIGDEEEHRLRVRAVRHALRYRCAASRACNSHSSKPGNNPERTP